MDKWIDGWMDGYGGETFVSRKDIGMDGWMDRYIPGCIPVVRGVPDV